MQPLSLLERLIIDKSYQRWIVFGVVLAFLGGCSAEVGSDKWCEQMNNQPKGEWSSNDAASYAKSCLFKAIQ
ncbi:MAG: DUF3012 domain-containing protein [Magnetococcales bacterium]|nr:DUF3012 domain-containing protein [Magnetococcales bacterium]